MNPLYVGLLLAVVFAGSHIGLATAPLRSRLVARLGEGGFRWLFFGVAATSFTLLVVFYADHRTEGGPGLALGTSPALRPLLTSVAVIGVTLMVGSFATYSGGPYDLDQPRPSRPARGLERVTRHPFLVGMALFAGAHALLAIHLIATVLMLAFATLAVVGARHQDAKLARLRGKPFADYLATTSALPFVAILSGRQRLVWRDLPLLVIAAGLAIAAALRQVHDEIFAHRGAWVVLVSVGGAVVILITSLLRERRAALRPRTRAA